MPLRAGEVRAWKSRLGLEIFLVVVPRFFDHKPQNLILTYSEVKDNFWKCKEWLTEPEEG